MPPHTPARHTWPALAAAAALAATGLVALAPTADATADATATAPAHRLTAARSCAVATVPGAMACKALKVTSGADTLAPSVRSAHPAAIPSGYGPAELRAAYALPDTGGEGATVAIVDAYDNPNAEADLATYRAQYGLPACTTDNGCFRKVDQRGGSGYPVTDPGWAEEISLDVDMVSATCPACHILLVEADTNLLTDLGAAVDTAVALGARFVSNSYGGGESAADADYDAQFFDHPGVAITASSGDAGYGVEYPAGSQYVTAVGGTSLRPDGTERGWTDTVWGGAGSGCSAYDPKPAWQRDTECATRTVADVSAVADPATGVAVYDTFGTDRGWEVFGGTSAAAPLIASAYALAGTPAEGSYPASYPYAHGDALNDVLTGTNGECAGSYLCTGAVGYDGPTGVGTPNGLAAFTG
ncbi:peptidase S8 [Streptomyces sp. PRB2-1]|uniref:Peptidase S8 n=1 Tax=Actinacidiphila epipremni TaxID=2053013 RepID=A0ABX0ZLS5_9ACTN|nr:peptidase S8 [Actinacidiphila epipremni]